MVRAWCQECAPIGSNSGWHHGRGRICHSEPSADTLRSSPATSRRGSGGYPVRQRAAWAAPRVRRNRQASEIAMRHKPLWSCPKCGAKLVGRNLWHACGPYTVEAFLAGKGPQARALFQRFVELVGRCGPCELAPAKTRVAVMVRVRFASVSSLSERGMTIAFGLRRRLHHRRIRRVEQLGQWFSHVLRVSAPEELDEELLGWLKESYAVGEQRA